jgi:hypothetical protein
MGAIITKTWYVYARDLDDKWLDDPLHSTVAKEENDNHHVGMFKHKIFKFALEEDFKHCSKIYLYHGWRKIKVHKDCDTITVTFSDNGAKDAWDTCKRSRFGVRFDANWSVASEESFVYIFKKKTYCDVVQ